MAAELATGYISLTVKYADAMKKINADFQNVSKTAKTAGDKAGKQFSQGVSQSAKQAAKGLDNTFKNTASSAAAAGRSSGSKFAQAFQSQMKGALKLDKAADGSGAAAIGGKVGKLFAGGIAAGIAAVGITKIFDQVLQQFQAVVTVGLSYERQMNNLKGVTGATAADMAQAAGDSTRARLRRQLGGHLERRRRLCAHRTRQVRYDRRPSNISGPRHAAAGHRRADQRC